MPRKREIQKRAVTPDPKYRSDVVAKFINVVMRGGKKAVAERIVYGALDLIAQKGKPNPVDLFSQALDNVRPLVEVKSRRVGGATYQVPVEVRSSRQMALAMRWMVEAARVRAGKSMGSRLADELLDAAEKRGNAIKKREDVHRMAEANKAFSHYRW
ncbi:MAG: 30S ribosomal protein S7 [Candidatus Muproteobacteria bacterium RIFCSPHIGHO2_01_FULL_65_16]|uniref:Small ribosomal subunit protein uS7 n=2 Tax=Candidatus Muproteobacteria TaxID=1817795 RepID=A0A1F6TLN8_9PROT|nr:MAG: 30S ribosomal protein S7 [Candidatus Muproteobacteria bacterium RIFCSPHIGHO2_01_FULL_65_16]OGI48459.1 MAG: 30S ribosomal protein S7 [Candidatus Muproteobacteria bacterium RIFCSPHIGHO2_02_FULL_65_16]